MTSDNKNNDITNKNKTLAYILPVIAIIISVIGFIRDCHQDGKLEDWQYNTEAVNTRPQIILIGEPKIIGFEFKTDEIILDKNELLQRARNNDTTAIPILVKSKVKWSINVTNGGNAIAKRWAFITTDSLTQLPIIRNLIRKLPKYKSKIKFTSFEKVNEMLPGDIEEITFAHSIRFIDTSNTFTLHALVLYENELGMLFDTYIWAQYRLNNFELFTEFDNKGNMRVGHVRKDILNYIEPVGNANDSYQIYSKDETDDIYKFLNELSKSQ